MSRNRLKAVEARLPEQVRRAGLTVESASSGFLMIVSLKSKDGSLDALALDDYLVRNIAPELKRVSGVGRVQSFGSEAACASGSIPSALLPIPSPWLRRLRAIQQQNVAVAPGRLGESPTVPGQKVTVPLNVSGQLQTPDQFAQIILRSNSDGSRLTSGRRRDNRSGIQSSSFSILDGGKPATAAAIQMTPGANAVSTSNGVRERLAELAATMPPGMEYAISYEHGTIC